MSGINSLVGATDPTFVFSDGPSNTWMDNWRPTTWATEVANNSDEYNFKENRPNYDPENYPRYTKKMARLTDPKWLNIISLLTNPPG